jgi:hypothetical protein
MQQKTVYSSKRTKILIKKLDKVQIFLFVFCQIEDLNRDNIDVV